MNAGSARTQRGVVFLLALTLLAITAATILGAMLTLTDGRSLRMRAGERSLADAKRLLLADLAAPDADQPPTGRRLGQWRLFPDLPIATGAGADAAEPSYDGLAESGGCATRTWSPGQPLTPVAAAGPAARCFGQVPWRDMGLALDDPGASDTAGVVPWVIVSPNLFAAIGCLRDLNPMSALSAYAGYACPGYPPYPWLRVVDERGNLVSDRVAFAVIIPGPPLGTQVRGPASGPAAFLDAVTVAAGCQAPCQPGTYDNARYSHPDGQPTVLIRAPTDAAAAERSGNYAPGYAFNDQLAYVTADELFATLERRARAELARRLLAFRTANGYFPYAAPFASAGGDCAVGSRFGHPPVADGSCGAGGALAMPGWFTDAGWHRYFAYAASPRCVAANAACNAPGLVVGARNDVGALLISPGTPIVAPPYAASRLAAQTPLVGGTPSSLPADYVDSVENAAGVADVFEATGALPAPNNDSLVIVE